MAKLLPKGASAPIAGSLTKVLFRAKWDCNDDKSDPMDVDTFILGTDANGNTVKFPSLQHPLAEGGVAPAISGYFISEGSGAPNPFNWIKPAKDERTGEAAGWDEESEIDLSKVPAEIVRLDALLAIYPLRADGATPNNHTFGMVNNPECEIADANTGKTLFPVNTAFGNTTMWGIQGIWIASLVRGANGWEVRNVMYADSTKFGYYNDFMDWQRKDIPASNV